MAAKKKPKKPSKVQKLQAEVDRLAEENDVLRGVLEAAADSLEFTVSEAREVLGAEVVDEEETEA